MVADKSLEFPPFDIERTIVNLEKRLRSLDPSIPSAPRKDALGAFQSALFHMGRHPTPIDGAVSQGLVSADLPGVAKTGAFVVPVDPVCQNSANCQARFVAIAIVEIFFYSIELTGGRHFIDFNSALSIASADINKTASKLRSAADSLTRSNEKDLQATMQEARKSQPGLSSDLFERAPFSQPAVHLLDELSQIENKILSVVEDLGRLRDATLATFFSEPLARLQRQAPSGAAPKTLTKRVVQLLSAAGLSGELGVLIEDEETDKFRRQDKYRKYLPD